MDDTDGLTGMLEDDQLALILMDSGGPQEWVDRMIAEANHRGGLDNITAVIVQIESVDAPSGEHPASSSSLSSS